MADVRPKDRWNSRIGVILAVAGSAVGLGNFLRFPGQAALYGGGAFMVAYFVSLLIMGLPICWAEWAMGRHAGQHGFNSCPGIMNAVMRHPAGKFLGVIGVVIPIVIYMYYVYIEAWCLGYAVNFLGGGLHFSDVKESTAFWAKFIGATRDGDAIGFGVKEVGGYLLVCFVLNFYLIYRGLARGVEWFCKYAMPALVLMAVVILVRVLTLGAPDPAHPENNVSKGLGYMWNPDKVTLEARSLGDGGTERWRPVELLLPAEYSARRAQIAADPSLRVVETKLWEGIQRPQVWLAAAGQVFFSLSVGFGIILTYASYLSRRDDVVLSGLSATSANEFCEVGLGGLITVPAAFVFLGIAGVAGQGTFDLGFKVLPLVFSEMPFGAFFGFLFFFLLFLAAVTSSLSMLQPGIAFLEEVLDVGRHVSVALLLFVTGVGTMFVLYFSADVKALDTMDFWAGTLLIYVLATVQIIVFGWVFGIDRGFASAHEGASMRIPKVFGPIMKYVCPLFLLTIFVTWIGRDVLTLGSDDPPVYYITDLFGDKPSTVARLTVGLILVLAASVTLIVARTRKYADFLRREEVGQ